MHVLPSNNPYSIYDAGMQSAQRRCRSQVGQRCKHKKVKCKAFIKRVLLVDCMHQTLGLCDTCYTYIRSERETRPGKRFPS